MNKLPLPDGWKEYPSLDTIYPFSSRFFQKRIYSDIANKISMNVVEYQQPMFGHSPLYEVDLQIPAGFSGLKVTLNIKAFTYLDLDFDVMEQDAREILRKVMA